MLNSKSQRTIDQTEAHNKSQSRVVTRDVTEDGAPVQMDGQPRHVATGVITEHPGELF